MIIVYHDPRVCIHHCHVLICIFYNKHIKFKSLPISCVTAMLAYLLFLRCIDLISINSSWPISTLLHHFTDIDSHLTHISQPFQQIETTVHNHHLPCSPQFFINPTHHFHCRFPRYCFKLCSSQLLCPILLLYLHII